MRRLALIAALVALAGCQTDTPQGDGGPEGRALPEAERAACLAEGGTVGRGGLFPNEICFRPTPDAGKACTKAGDCSGLCLSETKTCSTVSPQFGCFEFLDEDGKPQSICVD